MASSVSTIGTPMSFRQVSGRPPRADSPSTRKRRASAMLANLHAPSSTQDSFGNGSVGGASDQSSGQLRPTHSFTGRMNPFGGGGLDDDLDNFAKYIEDTDEEDEGAQGEEVIAATTRVVSFESDEESNSPQKRRGGIRGLFLFSRGYGRQRKNKKSAPSAPLEAPPTRRHEQPQPIYAPPPPQLLLQQSAPPALISPQHNEQPTNHLLPLKLQQRPQSSLSKIGRDQNHKRGTKTVTEVHYNNHSSQRSRSMPDYKTHNRPQPTLPRMGSFGMGIDTIPASPSLDSIDYKDVEEDPIEVIQGEQQIIPRIPSWNSASTTSVVIGTDHRSNTSTAIVPYSMLDDGHASSSGESSTGTPFATLDRTDSWNRRLERTDVYLRHYIPSRQELEELRELENYLGIFSAKTKHRFAILWRQLVPSLDVAKQRVDRCRTLQSQVSTSSMSTLSTMTHRQPFNVTNNKNKGSFYSIVLKRGPVQFEEYQDYHCEWILLTRGFVVARPNYKYIPRFQAGDLWTSVVQVQPTNPLSITLSCASRSGTTHLTLTQLKQQQQFGCYTYDISCQTPQEQASWLEALRRLVVHAHDSEGTNEKEMGGLGWQYRVVYVPFFTEAVTGNPVQKETILAGSTGHVDLNALDSYNSYAPLHYATRANHVRVMRFLLEAGADVHVGDGYGRTPMYYAELHQLPEATIQLLEENGAMRSKKPVFTAGLSRKAFSQTSLQAQNLHRSHGSSDSGMRSNGFIVALWDA